MVHAGMGTSHIQSFMAVLEIPSITHKHMKLREREILASIENVARKSCDQAIAEEINIQNMAEK